MLKQTESLSTRRKGAAALHLIADLDGKPTANHEELLRREIFRRDEEITDGKAKLVDWEEIENRFK